MTAPSEPDPRTADDVDASVESPAARARDAGAAPPSAEPPSAPPTPTPAAAARPYRRAWLVAIAADAMQWLFMPVFAPGFVSPANNVLDVVVGVLLVRWCGWHWAFLPTFIAEMIPGVDLVPTWTLALWLATRGRSPGPGRPG